MTRLWNTTQPYRRELVRYMPTSPSLDLRRAPPDRGRGAHPRHRGGPKPGAPAHSPYPRVAELWRAVDRTTIEPQLVTQEAFSSAVMSARVLCPCQLRWSQTRSGSVQVRRTRPVGERRDRPVPLVRPGGEPEGRGSGCGRASWHQNPVERAGRLGQSETIRAAQWRHQPVAEQQGKPGIDGAAKSMNTSCISARAVATSSRSELSTRPRQVALRDR